MILRFAPGAALVGALFVARTAALFVETFVWLS